MQKPGLSYAVSARDRREHFGRMPKDGACALLILWPFVLVALVYDELDTEGEPLPEDVASFFAHGRIDEHQLAAFVPLMRKKGIERCLVDTGDRSAGSIRVLKRAANDTEVTQYRMHINRNHDPDVQFATLTHEPGHLCLGHLGPDRKLDVPERHALGHSQQDLAAESVAYLVCERNGVKSKSQTFLSNFVNANMTVDLIDVYQVMRAAGQVETLLGIAAHTQYDRPAKPERRQRN